MVIFLENLTTCRLCEKTIKKHEKYFVFGPFISNEKSPLFFFNDSVFHLNCIQKHPLGTRVIQLCEEVETIAYKKPLVCCVCHQEINHPDDFFCFGFFPSEKQDPELAYRRCHIQCLPKLKSLEMLYGKLVCLYESNEWCGRGPKKVLETMKEAIDSKNNWNKI